MYFQHVVSIRVMVYGQTSIRGVLIVSLTGFLDRPEVLARVKSLRPKLPRKIPAPLKVEPRTKRYMLVGTAFDYLLRFELQRLAPHAQSGRWIAEYAPELIYKENGSTAVARDLLIGAPSDIYMLPEKVAICCREIISNAKHDLAKYVNAQQPTYELKHLLAGHAIRLAKLDSVVRASRLEPTFQHADPDDVEDLLSLLDIAPFESLLSDVLMLNPDFGETSRIVGGADADLISSDLLIDFKTTKKGEMGASDLDQLLGYLFLARKQRNIKPEFPAIDRLGLYFSRHGYLWSVEARAWTENPEFMEIEQWFFDHAKEYF